MKRLKKSFPLFFLLFYLVGGLSSKAFAGLSATYADGISGLTSNSVIDISYDSLRVWAGTGFGPAATSDNGVSWFTYLAEKEISALASNNKGVWAARSRVEFLSGSTIPIGDSISFSRDGGETWSTYGPLQLSYYGRLAYDLAVYDSIVYAACFYGGLIRSTNLGLTWNSLYSTQLDSINADSVDYWTDSFDRLTNRVFAVSVDTFSFPDTLSLWAGSAGGIHRFFFLKDITGAFHTYPDSIAQYVTFDSLTIDSTLIDTVMTYDTTIVQVPILPGDFVVSIGVNKIDSVKYVWAACRPANSGNFRIAYATDFGRPWNVAPVGGTDISIEGWDFGFALDTVYVATNDGLFRSESDYQTWELLSGFRDSLNQTFYQDSAAFYAVEVIDGAVWAGGSDGIVRTAVDNGWEVYRSQRDSLDHFAYPSPFSPNSSTRHGTTIHFMTPQNCNQATVKIYDYNLDHVKTVAENLPRIPGVESDDIVWDGQNEKGDYVANGVYFYRIILDCTDNLWGKVVMIR